MSICCHLCCCRSWPTNVSACSCFLTCKQAGTTFWYTGMVGASAEEAAIVGLVYGIPVTQVII